MRRSQEDTQLISLLEYYVLHIIGELSDDKRHDVKRIEPHLHHIYKIRGGWLDVISEQVQWSSEQKNDIRRIWNKYSGWAKQRGAIPDPDAFAASYVDQNFGKAHGKAAQNKADA
ncbi:hypothetical protein L1889_09860 [Paenalcaligenes niemegkensis]|uniref:hypothetical protein n=1 Tax=Paenalcaligenes niemegkensis TaxID=2895469 RepID=UPI001EE83BA0|nr:hypothetical protein [Paenalcaligenes niemegkensis]MCQ9616966.1 hypothetical protein [Paenalcaligenes niemegkensis]